MESHSLAQLRARTKIIATVGPACEKPQQLADLVRAGVDVFRLNMAHGGPAEQGQRLAAIRRVSQDLGQPIAVLVDLSGPKIRLGSLPGDMIECVAGEEFRFVRSGHAQGPRDLTASYASLVDELAVGDNVMLADGTVSMVVFEKTSDFARARVVQPGVIRSRQGLNLPGAKLSAPAMDESDRANAAWAADKEIDFIGLSFVRHPRDVCELKDLLRSRGSAARVIAKIEKQEALDHLDEIISQADGIMVARGDLGVEIDVARMPIVQKQIVATCQRHQKPVIIATQMLDSMQHSRRPTRAEVTDVANAILDGGDACMLSGETAIGQYPREAVEMMNQVALATEELFRKNTPRPPGEFRAAGLHPITSAVVYGAGHIAAQIDARLIVVASHSGATALALSKQRNFVRTAGISDSPQTLRQMCLLWGVIPLLGVPTSTNQNMLDAVTAWALADGLLARGDHVVLVAGAGLGRGSHNQIAVHQVP
jgi:pyruvate kinase